MKHQIYTEIDIEAPPEMVWQVLTDLDRYPDWNPFITSSVGKVSVGEKLTNTLQPPGGKAKTFKPMVTVEQLNGVLVPFLRKSLDTQTKQGFEEMNTALKARSGRAS